jgi:hypothetical protein
MKIRTDFVTNSSSDSFGVVLIDNPVLLEILARYKVLGTFGENSNFEIGAFYTEDEKPYITEPDPDIKTTTPAFHSYSAEEWNTPSSLEEVVENIIKVMDDDDDFYYEDKYDQQLYQQLKDELIQREDEINNAFRQVIWWSRKELYSGRFGCWEFKYDQENGEYYHGEETGNLDN